MVKLFNLLLLLFLGISTQAQIHEIGVFVGGSNYIGDVGSTTYIAPNEPALGLLYKWNKSPRHAYRFSYTQSKISSNDLNSKETSRSQRGYRFENNLKEVSLGLEFNFFDFNLHESSTKISPYVFSGVSYFLTKYTLTDTQTGISIESRTERRKSIAIPMIVGIKSNISPRLVLALETGARYTLTDNLDGSFNQGFGNLNNNDWYVFSGLTLTYTFGKSPCYCAE
jgi:hypothetical protein